MKIKETIQPSYDKADLDEAVATLRQGGIILYPTDTVWGIGCDATNEEAVQRIYALKRRQDSKSMLVLVAETHAVERLISDVPEIAYDLMELAVRPITICDPSCVPPRLLYLSPENCQGRGHPLQMQVLEYALLNARAWGCQRRYPYSML